MPDGAVAQVEQVADGLAGAVGLVGVDDAVAVAGVGVHDDHVDAGRQRHVPASSEVDLHDDDDGVDGQLAQPGEGAQHVVLGGTSTGIRVIA